MIAKCFSLGIDHQNLYVVQNLFSRGQILVEIHDAIAMRTQTWVGKNVMLSRGQIQFNIHNAIAMMTQIWVGKNVMLSRGQILFKNSRCHCYDDTNLGGKNSQCFHEVVLGSYRCTLL